MSTFNRVLKAFGAGLYGRLGTIVIQIAGVPLFISLWGEQVYGEWLIMSSVPAYLSMSNLGYGVVASNEMSMEVANNHRHKASAIFQSIWWATLFFSAFLVGIAILVIHWLPVTEFLNIAKLPVFKANQVITLLLLHTVVALPYALLVGVYRSEGNYARGVFLNSTIRIIELLLVLLVAIFGYGVVEAACCYLLVRLLGMAITMIDLKNRYEWFSLSINAFHWSIVKRLFSPSLYFMFFPLGNTFIIQGMTTLTGIMLGATQVVVLNTVRMVINFSKNINNLINNSVLPELSLHISQKDYSKARLLHTTCCQLNTGLSLIIGITLMLGGVWIIQFWTNGEVEVESSFLYAFVLVSIVNTFWNSSLYVPLSVNQHMKISKIFMLGSLVSLFCAWAFITQLGLLSIPLAILLVDVFMSFFVLKISLSVLSQSLTEFRNQVFSMTSWLNLFRKLQAQLKGV